MKLSHIPSVSVPSTVAGKSKNLVASVSLAVAALTGCATHPTSYAPPPTTSVQTIRVHNPRTGETRVRTNISSRQEIYYNHGERCVESSTIVVENGQELRNNSSVQCRPVPQRQVYRLW